VALINPFSPAAGNNLNGSVYIMIYDRLLEGNAVAGFTGSLATSFDTTDYQTYNFTLRDDVYFHNGDKFTAQDVVNTIELSREGAGSLGLDMWRPVEEAIVINDTTLQLVLSTVNVDFYSNIAQSWAGIVSKRAIEEDTEAGYWIGTGAFRVTDFVSNVSTTLERNDDYWGEAPITQRIIFRFTPEVTARTIQLQNGELHASLSVNETDMHLFVDNDDFVIYSWVLLHPNYIGFNMMHPVTSDLNFRRAVAHAIDREAASIVAMEDWFVPEPSGTFFGMGTEFRNNDIPAIPYDPDKAKEYLALTDYNGEVLELVVTLTQPTRAAELMQEQLSVVGININVNRMDMAAFSAYATFANNESPLVVHLAPQVVSAGNYRNSLVPGPAINRARYNNPVVTEMLNRAPTITDRAAREALYREVQEIVADDLPYFTLFFQVQTAVATRGLGGIRLWPESTHDYRQMFLVLED
jgi:peptide/nickel transport system substrate-binding protein